MNLSPLPERPAPNFTLVDQFAKPVTLRKFRGKSVVLAFMDPLCTEVCPFEAQEFLYAEKVLGSRARRVVFVGVNVNPHANTVEDVNRFSSLHGLNSMKNWYFLTGSVAQLTSVWSAYGIKVIVPKNEGQTTHSSYLYFLNLSGRERYLADPTVLPLTNGYGYLPKNSVLRWGQGIARYLRKASKG